MSLLAPEMTVQRSTVVEVSSAPSFATLMKEYEEEGLIPGMPGPVFRVDVYADMESAGALHVFSATVDGELVGVITVLASAVPHYDRVIAITESFFVGKAHRKTGAGLRLLKMAEEKARELGARGLLVSAPTNGALAQVLPRCGYRDASRVFYKVVADA